MTYICGCDDSKLLCIFDEKRRKSLLIRHELYTIYVSIIGGNSIGVMHGNFDKIKVRTAKKE